METQSEETVTENLSVSQADSMLYFKYISIYFCITEDEIFLF